MDTLEKNIATLKITEAEKGLKGEGKKEKKVKKKDATRALQTYFRNSYRTHISLSALADRKSNIMVRLNSLLIGLLIVFFDKMAEGDFAAMVTGLIFLLTALASLIFAALAARPHITSNISSADVRIEEVQRDIFFFGNFRKLDLDKYEEIVNKVIKDPELVYDNMVRDLYFLGKVLDRKFRLLQYSYSVFVWGLAVTVVSFIVMIHL